MKVAKELQGANLSNYINRKAQKIAMAESKIREELKSLQKITDDHFDNDSITKEDVAMVVSIQEELNNCLGKVEGLGTSAKYIADNLSKLESNN